MVSERHGTQNASSYEHDAAGNVVAVTDPAGVRVERTYNEHSELTSEKANTGPAGAQAVKSYAYDNGLLASVTDQLGNVTSYGYDDAGRLTATTAPIAAPNVTQIVYNEAGEKVKVIDADGRVRSFTYDLRGRPATTSDARGTTSYHY
ncbi:MAG: RHS repeat protein, partial [Actinomycetota bacterium]|nr:RHS repeat protein [Actinomycetota bacterium]